MWLLQRGHTPFALLWVKHGPRSLRVGDGGCSWGHLLSPVTDNSHGNGRGRRWSVKDEGGKRIKLETEKFPVCHTKDCRHDATGHGENREAVTREATGSFVWKCRNLLHLRKFSKGSVIFPGDNYSLSPGNRTTIMQEGSRIPAGCKEG